MGGEDVREPGSQKVEETVKKWNTTEHAYSPSISPPKPFVAATPQLQTFLYAGK